MHINKKYLLWLLASIIVLILSIFAVKIIYRYTNKPVYNITAEISGGWIWEKQEVHYILYKNGEYEKIDEYDKKDIEIYDLQEQENISNNQYAKYTEEIIGWCNDRGLAYHKLFIVNDDYLFTVENSSQSLYNTTLYKFQTNGKAKKIAEFTESNISHIQMIEE